MQHTINKYNHIIGLLNHQDMQSILTFALSHRNLAKLVNKLKLNPRDIKTLKIPSEDLAGSLAKGIFSDQNILKEVGYALDLYSAEAIKAIHNNQIEDFRNSIRREKGHLREANTARLIWALLMENTSAATTEAKTLITELIHKERSMESEKTDAVDGEHIQINEKEQKPFKRHRNTKNKGKKNKGENRHIEQEILKYKSEIEALKQKNAKLHQHIQQARDSSKIKAMGQKFKLLEKENREMKSQLNRDYVPKEEFDALKKETDRLYQLCRSPNRSTQKNMDVIAPYSRNHFSLWTGIKNGITRFNPFCRQQRHGKNCRVGIFVDVQNMFYSAKNLYHGRLDFEKFLEVALQGRKLVQATAYIVKTPEIDQSKFINLLKNNKYEVKTIDLKTGMNGYAKGNWDVGMVMDIFELADRLDVIALASGDGDFVPLVKYLQKRGIRVEVYAFAYNTAIDLKECADRFYPLQEDLLIKDQRGSVKQH